MTSVGKHQSRKSFINKTCLESRIREREPLLDKSDNNNDVRGIEDPVEHEKENTRYFRPHPAPRLGVTHCRTTSENVPPGRLYPPIGNPRTLC